MERAELRQLLEKSCGFSNFVNNYNIDTYKLHSGGPDFREGFARAVSTRAKVVLCDPSWGVRESAEVDALMQEGNNVERGWLLIPTGGSSGHRGGIKAFPFCAAGFIDMHVCVNNTRHQDITRYIFRFIMP